MNFRILFLTLACLIFHPFVSNLSADEVVPAGDQFRVNTFSPQNQGFPEVAVASDGTFVVAWESFEQDGSGNGVFLQRYASDGSELGDELQVNQYTSLTQSFPSVAAADNDDFLILWHSDGQDNDGFGIYARRLRANGTWADDEYLVNSYTTDDQNTPVGAFAEDGSLLIVWDSGDQDGFGGGIYGQLYDSAGNPQADEFQINETTGGHQNDPAVVARPGGGFLVVWESDNVDAGGEAVVMQRFGADGGFIGGETLVNTTESGNQENPDVAVTEDGRFIVVWESMDQDGSDLAAVARLYDPEGVPTSDEILLNTFFFEDQEWVGVTEDDRGGFVAIWESEAPSGGQFDEIWVRRITVEGNLHDPELQINTASNNRQVWPSIDGEDGRLVGAWHSWTGDGSGTVVYARRLEVPGLFDDGFESGDTSSWSTP